jgi:small subunit ribosomal protein S1|tara:strand:- start:450 stop:1622 length:1173 start_codon:yes stop_codon:yes gene_type:complete
MIEQEITIRLSDDPFDTKTIKVKVPRGTKIMCTEMYAADAISMYNLSDEDLNQLTLSEEGNNYMAQGEIVSIREENHIIGGEEVKVKVEALVDISGKNTAVCILSKEPPEIVDQLEIGMGVDIKVKNTKFGVLYASINDAVNEVKSKEIYDSIGNRGVAYTSKVKELIYGGYWVDISGVECFMPGSLGGLNKLHDFEALVGKEIIVMPITYSNEKQTIVVSHREYLRTMIPSAVENLRENIKEHITGIVTGTAKFGIFAEFNQSLTGLIPKAELDESTLQKFDNRDIKPGDEIKFWPKEIISDRKIMLSQAGPKVDLWDGADQKYKPMMVTEGKVTKVTKYGAFIELEKGISGLIHKTKLKNVDLTRGDIVNIKIGSVNVSDRKITMNLA